MTNSASARINISNTEFIALAALLTCLTALSIDIMLPVLPQMAAALGIDDANNRQWIITSYLGGSVVGQLIVGPVSDRYGRLPVLYAGLALFVVCAITAGAATSFEALLMARAVQGFAGAAPRIVVTAIVRDLYEGRQMARIMSLVMTTFIMVPIFAPTVGQVLGWAVGWRSIFHFLAVIGAVTAVWTWARLAETSPRHRLASSGQAQSELPPPVPYVTAIVNVFRSRRSMGYVVANGFMFGCLMAYILSSQQIFVDVYGLGDWFPVAFGGIAIGIAIATFINSRIVVQRGMRYVSHRALVAFMVTAMLMAGASLLYAGRPPFWLLWFALWVQFLCFGLIVSNFSAIAIEPLGRVAGTASSVMGSYTTLSGAVLGTLVGQLFNMTALPINLGFVIYSAMALIIVLITERRQNGGSGFGAQPAA